MPLREYGGNLGRRGVYMNPLIIGHDPGPAVIIEHRHEILAVARECRVSHSVRGELGRLIEVQLEAAHARRLPLAASERVLHPLAVLLVVVFGHPPLHAIVERSFAGAHPPCDHVLDGNELRSPRRRRRRAQPGPLQPRHRVRAYGFDEEGPVLGLLDVPPVPVPAEAASCWLITLVRWRISLGYTWSLPVQAS